MIALINFLPFGVGESLGAIVAEAVDEADKSGLDYRLTAMGTIVEGEWEPVMKLIKRMRDRVAKKAPRVYLTISIDDRKDKRRRLEAKIKSVETRLSKSLRK
jgi:uncharacterized protein (TIGR00106 family)